MSAPAREAIEAAGGSVELVYYNALGLRALMRPAWFARKGRLVPRAVQRVPLKLAARFDRVGTVPYAGAPPSAMPPAPGGVPAGASALR